MQREVSRQKKLPPFVVDLGGLEALWSRLSELFVTPEEVYARLEIRLPTEVLTFKSVQELREWQKSAGKSHKVFPLVESRRVPFVPPVQSPLWLPTGGACRRGYRGMVCGGG
jgi:hypothetical protein